MNMGLIKRGYGSLMLLLALGLLAGCARYDLPRTQFDAQGKEVAFKRQALYDRIDYIHRFFTKAYHRPDKHFADVLSIEEAKMVQELGTPDYCRGPIYSLHHERIVEWVYLKKNVLAQFRTGEMVYRGPVTDMEQLLIQRGYPRHTISDLQDVGPARTTWVYSGWFNAKNDEYSFSDGYLSAMVE
jgi:hypothetical protein